MVISNNQSQPRQEGVAMAQMSDAAPRPSVKGRVGVTFRRRRITFQKGDFSAGRRQGQRGPEAGHAGADHQHLVGHFTQLCLFRDHRIMGCTSRRGRAGSISA